MNNISRLLTLSDLKKEEAEEISTAFSAIGWNKPAQQFEGYFQESLDGKRDAIVARVDGVFAGYGTLIWRPTNEVQVPEISDLNVLPDHQRQGIGSVMMDELERRAGEKFQRVCLGVGLLADYAPAHLMYLKRGYLPDGKGLYHHGAAVKYGETIRVDDDTCLWFVKDLSPD